jgi:hypothetical protein
MFIVVLPEELEPASNRYCLLDRTTAVRFDPNRHRSSEARAQYFQL